VSDGSPIEWTNASWNPVRGCDKVSAGCKNCYAETFSERWRGIKGHPFEQGFDLRLVPEALDKPLRWKKPRKIFVNSMSDLFHEDIPNEYIAAVFGVMAACPQHTFQVLTKRAARMREWFDWVWKQDPEPWTHCHSEALAAETRLTGDLDGTIHRHSGGLPDRPWPLPNVHLGVSAENQATADERIPLLLQCPAAVRWVSAEPLLGPIVFGDKGLGQGSECSEDGWMVRVDEDGCCISCGEYVMWYGIDWVVVGGESGPGARICDVPWIRSIVEQCRAAEVPAFVKQLGARPVEIGRNCGEPSCREFCPHVSFALGLASRKGGDPAEWPEDLRVREFPRRSAP
jgi:protein gp37